jgi:hypothetical protein
MSLKESSTLELNLDRGRLNTKLLQAADVFDLKDVRENPSCKSFWVKQDTMGFVFTVCKYLAFV